jgi:hypothetical protein
VVREQNVGRVFNFVSCDVYGWNVGGGLDGEERMSECPKCGKWMKKVTADLTMDDQIIRATGICKTHGETETNDWEYWDFFPGEEQQEKEPTHD